MSESDQPKPTEGPKSVEEYFQNNNIDVIMSETGCQTIKELNDMINNAKGETFTERLDNVKNVWKAENDKKKNNFLGFSIGGRKSRKTYKKKSKASKKKKSQRRRKSNRKSRRR